jgi:hypothetical protein
MAADGPANHDRRHPTNGPTNLQNSILDESSKNRYFVRIVIARRYALTL